MTLYNHFPSKEALILAALHRRDAEFREWFAREVESRARTPRARLLAAFDVIADWCVSPGFYGCTFINASAEFHRRDDPIHVAAAENKRAIARYLRDLAAAAGARDPKSLSEELTVLLHGGLVLSHIHGGAAAVRRAADAAKLVIDDALPAANGAANRGRKRHPKSRMKAA
jgi:AcrR family transcriptional regulator